MACMICAEEVGSLHRVCKCDVLIHRACFEEMTERCPTHAERCGVCLEPYPLVRAGWRCVPHADLPQVASFYYLFFAGVVLLNIGLTLLGDLVQYYQTNRYLFWGMSLAMPPYFHLLRYARYRVCSCARLVPRTRLDPEASVHLRV